MKTLHQQWADLNTISDHPRGTAIVVLLAAALTATAGTAPTITAPPPTTAAYPGNKVILGVAFTGDAPIAYQWRMDGRDLPGQTNKSLVFNQVQASDEGDYVVVITNYYGAVTSQPPARLYVVPSSTNFLKADFTKDGQRLPYFIQKPENYDPQRAHSLACVFHGAPGDETVVPSFLSGNPVLQLLMSYKQQAKDPVILVYPTRRQGDNGWDANYVRLASALLDRLIQEYNINTNRIYVEGFSEGVHAAWDLLGLRPDFFAAALLQAGWQGSASAALLRDTPIWAACAADDVLVGNTRPWVNSLRLAGNQCLYSEYKTGGHTGGIGAGLATPTIVDWLLAQQRGQISIQEPLLAITHPTASGYFLTGATNLTLSGTANALGYKLTALAWTNTLTTISGAISGTNDWTTPAIRLAANKTNLITVTATTTSWNPALGGNTTFCDILQVICAPVKANLSLAASAPVLNWQGGAGPFQVQHASDLIRNDWVTILTNALPPVNLPMDGAAGFYRIVGQ